MGYLRIAVGKPYSFFFFLDGKANVDKKQASDLIEAAIGKAIHLDPDHDSGDIIVEWAVIAFVDNPNKEKGSGYQTFYSNGVMPHHHAKGLFHQGVTQLNVSWLAEQLEDDDD